jgi:autotransporter adhesin
MNRIYRLVWCRSRKVLVVASELASSHHGGCSSGASKVDRRSIGATRKLLFLSLMGASGLLFASGASAQSSGDAKLDDLQSLIAKYDTSHASAAPVQAVARNAADVVGSAPGETASSSLASTVKQRAATVASGVVPAQKSSSFAAQAASASVIASPSASTKAAVAYSTPAASSQSALQSAAMIASSNTSEADGVALTTADAADRKLHQATGGQLAQQVSMAKNGPDSEPAESAQPVAITGPAQPPAATVSALDKVALVETDLPSTPEAGVVDKASVVETVPTVSSTPAVSVASTPAAKATLAASVAADAPDKPSAMATISSPASASAADAVATLPPKAPVAVAAAADAVDKSGAVETSAALSTGTAAQAAPTPASVTKAPLSGSLAANASATSGLSGSVAFASDAADRRLKHSTDSSATASVETKSSNVVDDTDTAQSVATTTAASVSPLTFAPLSPVSAAATASLLPSLGTQAALSGSVAASVPVFPTPSSSPTGLIVGNGGVVGTATQLLGSTTNSLFAGGNGYVTNGSLQVSNANFSQGYSIVSVLGVPTLTLDPVGTLLTSTSGAVVGGTGVNSHLTLLGGVSSSSYIYNINNGNPSGVLGLLLPSNAPAFASTCLNALVVSVACYGINAAQDYQVLVGDGASANGSKEVVIGTNASHTLPLVNADTAFPGSGANDPNNPTGVPTANYEARLGHSVVIGDSASGTANAQVILGAEATANAANSVALGYQSVANRGGLTSYTAYGLTALQQSAGEVSIGSPGQERQITNVAAGSSSTDAVNVAQLQGVAADADNSVQYDNAGKTSITLAGTPSTDGGLTNGTTLTNLHQGSLSATSTDAVNGAQLYATNDTVSTIYNTTSKYFQANSTGIGSSALGADSIAAGPGAIATGNTSIALGSGALTGTGNSNSIAIGTGANAIFANSIALGSGSITTVGAQTGYTAYGLAGPQTSAGELNIGNRQITGVAPGQLGTDAVNVEQLQGVATTAANSVQYDDASKASIALAGSPSTDGGVIGGTKVTNVQQGTLSATSTDAVNGAQLYATNNTVSTIYNTTSKYFQANSTGIGSSALGTDSIAAGPAAVAAGDTSIALGSGAVTGAGNAVAIGTGANATFANSIALGSGSITTVGAQTGYIAYGLALPQISSGELNVGNRQITGVAPGSAATDAVNLEQLEGVSADAANSVQYDSAAKTSVTLAGAASTDGGLTLGTTLTNLHQGLLSATSTDAVNGAQLWHWTQDATNQYSNYSLYNDLTNTAGTKYYSVHSLLAGSVATGLNAAAAGPDATAAGTDSFAMGNGATAQGDYSLAVSDNTLATGTNSIAMGSGATASFANSIALGAGSATVVGAQINYVAYGLAAPQTSAGELNIGNRQITGVAAGSSPDDAVNLAQLEAVTSQAVGGATNSKLAVVYDADTSGNPTNTVTLTGDGTGKPVTVTNLAAGAETAASTDAVNGGQLYHWTQDGTNVYSNLSLYNDITALDQSSGSSSRYVQVNSTAGGATAGGTNSVAVGPTASSAGANSVAVGSGASAAAANSVALGAGSVASRDDTVSVGSPGSERQITNVAAGTADTDAANVGQVNSGVQQAENWAANYTDQRLGALSSQIQQIGNRANAGVAAAMAMAGLPQAYEPGKSMAAVAAGTFRSESSIAVGVSTISEGGRWVYKLTGSVDTRGDGGVSIGAGMQW